MGDQDQALNDAGGSPDPAPQNNPDELVSTVDLSAAMDAEPTPEGGAKPEANGEKSAEAKPSDEDDKTGSDPDKDGATDTRFDKHPRFIELHQRLKAAEGLIDKLQATPAVTDPKPKDGATPAELPYKDVTQMSDEELLDWQSEDPKGYADNLSKMVSYQVQQGIQSALDQKTEAERQKDLETKVDQTYANYAKENPDFTDLWESGEITAYMDDHPGHVPISAHMALTMKTKQKSAIDEAVAKALKESETARRSTQKSGSILGAGPRSIPQVPQSNADELKNPKKYGGATSVLAARLARMRQQSG